MANRASLTNALTETCYAEFGRRPNEAGRTILGLVPATAVRGYVLNGKTSQGWLSCCEIAIPYSKDVNFRSFLLLVLRRIAFLPHGLTTHLDAMSVVNETVEDAVSDGGIADLFAPARDRQLGSEDGGTSLVA